MLNTKTQIPVTSQRANQMGLKNVKRKYTYIFKMRKNFLEK